LSFHHIERCGLIIVNFSSRLGDAFDDSRITRNVLSNVLNDRERRDDTQRPAAPVLCGLSVSRSNDAKR